MKTRIVLTVIAGVALLAGACNQGSKSKDPVSVSKANELSRLPEGLRVVHTPNPVPATREGRSGQIFTWLYRTAVTALDDDVRITEFGAFTWHNGHWDFGTIYNRPFNAEEFAEWYSCPGSVISKGATAADPSNYTGADELSHSKTRWYFIGTNSKGEKIKGEAVVEHLAEEKK